MIMRKLPVFFHIPKNAGTYIYNCVFRDIFDNYNTNPHKCNLEVIHDGAIIFRIIGSSDQPLNKFYRKMNNANYYKVDLEHLNLSDIDVFLVEVCDEGFHSCKEHIYDMLPSNSEPYEFICLREPYDRIISIYNYVQSTQSSHESYHGKFGDMTFVQYLNSELLEGSWLIRKLLNISDTEVVTEDHFDRACAILDDMIVFDIKDIDNNIHKIFQICYDIEPTEFTDHVNRYKNETINKVVVPFNSLDQKTQDTFMRQTFWDHQLYKRYILNQ